MNKFISEKVQTFKEFELVMGVIKGVSQYLSWTLFLHFCLEVVRE